MAFDVIRFLQDHRIDYSPGSGRYTNTRCVFCTDSGMHMGWSNEGRVFCWKCGGHTLLSAVRRVLSLGRVAAEEVIVSYDSIHLHRNILNRKEEVRASTITLPGEPMNKYHRKYLSRRGFNPEYLEQKYRLLGTGPGAVWNKMDYALRVIIPIIAVGRIVSFQGRDITGRSDMRYKGCPKEQSVIYYKDLLYGEDDCRGESVGVVEGVVDQWRMGDGFVCTFGTSLTELQVKRLSRFRRIVFVFDPEPEAQARARSVASKLSAIGRVVEVVETDLAGRDPGDLSEKEAGKLRRVLGI